MKYFTFILSLYMLALTCLPCSDQGNCTITIESQHIADSSGQDDHNHGKDLCPPFCQCTCCGVASFYEFSIPALPIISSIISDTICIYTTPTLSEVYTNIWQPPKLS